MVEVEGGSGSSGMTTHYVLFLQEELCLLETLLFSVHSRNKRLAEREVLFSD